MGLANWNRNLFSFQGQREIRQAIKDSCYGLREFRITQFKFHRGLPYGYELNTSKWVVIADWQER